MVLPFAIAIAYTTCTSSGRIEGRWNRRRQERRQDDPHLGVLRRKDRGEAGRGVSRCVQESSRQRVWGGRGLVNTIPSLSLTLKKTGCTALVIDAEKKGRRECNRHVDLHGVRGERSSWKGKSRSSAVAFAATRSGLERSEGVLCAHGGRSTVASRSCISSLAFTMKLSFFWGVASAGGSPSSVCGRAEEASRAR